MHFTMYTKSWTADASKFRILSVDTLETVSLLKRPLTFVTFNWKENVGENYIRLSL